MGKADGCYGSDKGRKSFTAKLGVKCLPHEDRAHLNARIPLFMAVPLLCMQLSGCMRARVDESREQATAIESTESVVVLAKPQIEGTGAEAQFLDCVSDRLVGSKPAIHVHSNESFTDKLFPWFEPGTVQSRPVGSVGANVTGTSAVIGAIVPLPFIARVQGAACQRLGDQLHGFLAGSAGKAK